MGDEEKKPKKKKSTKKAEEGGEAAPAKSATSSSTKKKATRSGSNVFSMFTQYQVQEFKEAFGLIDSDKDGFISKKDLAATFDSLGRMVTDAELESMMAEATGPINFTMFLTIFGDKASGTDEEDVILNAFNFYDDDKSGKMSEDVLRKHLTTWGDKFSDAEVDDAFGEAPIDGKGMIDIKAFTKILTGGAEDDAAA